MPKTQQTVDRIPFTKEYINIYWHTKLHDSQTSSEYRYESLSLLWSTKLHDSQTIKENGTITFDF